MVSGHGDAQFLISSQRLRLRISFPSGEIDMLTGGNHAGACEISLAIELKLKAGRRMKAWDGP
jgi:hypothetical protein